MAGKRTELEQQTELDELDVPPAIACAQCRRFDCAGSCAVAARATAGLPWENTELPWLLRLWRTAELSALEPGSVFGSLGRGRLGLALGFGFTCEGLALASLGVSAALVVGLFWPESLFAALRSPWVRGVALLAWLGATLGMLLIHMVWGACMELGARLAGAEADQQRGFRFGMYSTGWDLLTSPAGIALSLGFRGFSSFIEPLLLATRVARKGVDAYLIDCRGFDERTRKSAFQVTVAAFGAAFLALLVVVAVGFAHWLRAALA